jgi:hypothetical protein
MIVSIMYGVIQEVYETHGTRSYAFSALFSLILLQFFYLSSSYGSSKMRMTTRYLSTSMDISKWISLNL